MLHSHVNLEPSMVDVHAHTHSHRRICMYVHTCIQAHRHIIYAHVGGSQCPFLSVNVCVRAHVRLSLSLSRSLSLSLSVCVWVGGWVEMGSATAWAEGKEEKIPETKLKTLQALIESG